MEGYNNEMFVVLIYWLLIFFLFCKKFKIEFINGKIKEKYYF